MKITRRQLRKLIINEIRIKPGGELDPEYSEKLTSMVDTEDEAFITQADELAPMLGYEGDSFAQDFKKYNQVSIMGAVGEFSAYLTDEHMKMLMNIKDKELFYAIYGWSGFGFKFKGPGRPPVIPRNDKSGAIAIPSDDFYEMQYRIAAKKRDIDDDDIAEHEGMDTGVEAAHDLAQAIMSLSKQTFVSMYTIEDAGIGELLETTGSDIIGSGAIKFYDPEYEALHKAGKLVIKRN